MTALSTPFARRLGLSVPVVQAPVGSAATPALAAAVSAAGGLGSLALTWTPAQLLPTLVGRVRALTDRPFAANLVLRFDVDARLGTLLDLGVPVVSTSWGDPAPMVERVHAAGALHVHAVASAQEARAAADAGVDVVVAQGWEAGGHVLGRVATLPLVPAVVDAVAPLPVLAAGGIGDGRGLAAALVLGAQGAWVGTRFLLADEADVHPDYRAALQGAAETATEHGLLFDGGWPDAPHRVLRSAVWERWEDAGRPPPGARPGEGEEVARTASGRSVPRYAMALPTADAAGAPLDMALYAGQGVGLCRRSLPAADVVAALRDEALAALSRDGSAPIP